MSRILSACLSVCLSVYLSVCAPISVPRYVHTTQHYCTQGKLPSIYTCCVHSSRFERCECLRGLSSARAFVCTLVVLFLHLSVFNQRLFCAGSSSTAGMDCARGLHTNRRQIASTRNAFGRGLNICQGYDPTFRKQLKPIASYTSSTPQNDSSSYLGCIFRYMHIYIYIYMYMLLN